VRVAGGSALHTVLGARLPESVSRPGRPIVPHWPFLVVAAVVFRLSISAYDPLEPVSIAYAAAVAAPVLLAWRRPGLAVVLAVLVVVGSTITALAGSPAAVPPPWLLNLVVAHLAVGYVAGLALPLRAVGWAFAVMAACGAGHAVLLFGPKPPSFVTVLTWAAVVAVAALLGVRHRDQHERLLTAIDESGRRRAREEHDQVARELHDSVAHHLSELAVRASSAPQRLPDVSATVAGELADLGTLARGALAEMRSLLGVLRGDGGPDRIPQPGLADIGDLAAAARRSGAPVELALTGDADLPPGTAVSAYRIVQEALSNAARHATGASVDVVVAPVDAELLVRISNKPTAAPPQPAPGAGLGLVGMRERVRLLRGHIHTGPTPDGGFVVDVRLPLEPPP
jgi:signal transduction histidine kinase